MYVKQALRALPTSGLLPLGLTSGYVPALSALAANKALSQKALTELAGIEQPTMAATLGRMERDGLIEREVDPEDKRSTRFSLTRAAVAKRAAIEDVIADFTEVAVRDLTRTQRVYLQKALERIIVRVERSLNIPP